MLIEGRGKVSPTPEIVRLTASDVEHVRTVAASRNAFRGYSARRDTWGQGLVNDPAFCGLLGEHALCIYIGRRVGIHLEIDATLRERGDDGKDVEVAGLIIEVKTRVTGKKYLIRRVDDRKRIRPLKSDFVVFAKLVNQREIHLLGWMTRAQARQAKHSKSERGDWWNLEVDERELRRMFDLVEEIKLARAA